MARSKTIGKGKAPSSSMERTMKKRKFDTSQTIKKGKGKRRDSSSESEEASETGGGGGGGGGGTAVPVLVPLMQKGAVGNRYRCRTNWYRYRRAEFWHII